MTKVLILLLLALLYIGCSDQEGGAETDIVIPVSVQEIKLKPIEEFIVATGTVSAQKEVVLYSETSGYYHLLKNQKTSRNFAFGDFVKEGIKIVRLENPEYENTIKIESQRLNLDISKREFEKQQSLYDKGGVTLRELKEAERSYIDAEYSYENALIQLSKLDITSPFDGFVVDIPYYTPGTKVNTNLPMVKLMNYSNLYLELNLPGKDLPLVKVRQAVRITNYSLPEDTLGGVITQVSPAIDPSSRSFKVAVNIQNPDWILRPGMFVKAELVVARRDSAIVIPKDIILSKRRGKSVFVVEKGAAMERVISTGLENPDQVEVLEGLKENERLVIKGFETLRHRSKVKIIR